MSGVLKGSANQERFKKKKKRCEFGQEVFMTTSYICEIKVNDIVTKKSIKLIYSKYKPKETCSFVNRLVKSQRSVIIYPYPSPLFHITHLVHHNHFQLTFTLNIS